MLLTDQLLIVRAVPLWLRNTVVSQWLGEWLQQLCLQPVEDLCRHLLAMLLNANWVSAGAMLESAPQLLSAPEWWVSTPLQLEATLKSLTEPKS